MCRTSSPARQAIRPVSAVRWGAKSAASRSRISGKAVGGRAVVVAVLVVAVRGVTVLMVVVLVCMSHEVERTPHCA